MKRNLTYFVSDVHLGLQSFDPADREARFVSFLRGLPQETDALYMLGDIWDFWYEYRDVVPKGYVRVLAALQELMDRGVKVYFFNGNHDIWTYSYFEELGMKKLTQPCVVDIAGKKFCLGHGDGLGPTPFGYRVIKYIFNNRPTQILFSTLHPWIAYRIGNVWSKHSRLSHNEKYEFRGVDEPLYKFAESFSEGNDVDFFIFGHYHAEADVTLPKGNRLLLLKDWMSSSPYICFDGIDLLTDNNK